MSTKKATKRALLTSILTICLCIVMLIGSTFAWFTDTASTNVNKIESGTLKVALEMQNSDGNWTDAKGKTLSWVQDSADADGNPTTSLVDGKDILWEPGCTYQLQPIRVRNDGNLALKYKIEITGIDGDAKLNKAITWTISDDALGSDHSLGVDGTSEALTIKGHMDENAGNEYQNLTINGIAITVYATQLNSESDSYGPDYDINATYPIEIIPDVTNVTLVKTGDNYTYTDDKVTVSVPAAEGSTAPVVTIKKTAVDTATIAVDAATQDAVAYDVSVSNTSTTAPATITLNIGKGLTNVVVYHNSTAMVKVDSNPTDGQYMYDSATGIVTFMTSSFSPFTIVADAPVAVANGVRYYDFTKAINAGGNVALMKDVDITATGLTVAGTVTLNLNGHSIKTGEEMSTNIKVSGKLTVKDSADTGRIYTEDAYKSAINGYCVIRVLDNGEFTLDSGTIYAVIAENAEKYGQFAIGVNGNGKVTINGGKVEAGWYAIAGNGQDADTSSSINVFGGTLISTSDYVIYHPQNGILNITGGVIDGAAGGVQMNRGTLVVTGGTIICRDTGNTGEGGDGTSGTDNAAIHLNAKYGDVNAQLNEGATLTAEGNALVIIQGEKHTVTLTGTHPEVEKANNAANN